VLPWLLTFLIIAVVAVICRFAEERPRSDDPPDTAEDRDPAPAVLPVAA
jgi:hypothetical protein